MIIVQLISYCALFTLMVKLGVGNSALNGLFFYPKPVQDSYSSACGFAVTVEGGQVPLRDNPLTDFA